MGNLLQKAVGQGMLSLGEFTERMDTALAAKTRAELNSVLVDLPGIALSPEYLAQQQVPITALPGSMPQQQHPQQHLQHRAQHHPQPTGDSGTIRGRMSTISRSGRWSVPAAFTLDTKFSSITLDLTRAVMSTQVVRIHVRDVCSSIALTLPPEATADTNGVEPTGSSITNRVEAGPPYGPLHVIVTGKISFGSLTVKYPFGARMRRMLGT